MISTKQLRYFDALARLGHFGRAAEQCSVTQPALSMQISQLERQLGVDLVERYSTGIVLTAAGREIARRASSILSDLRDLSDIAARYRAPFSTALRIGIIPTVAPYLLPRLLPRLTKGYPGLEVYIRETQTALLVTELRAADLDVLVLALPIKDPEIETLELLSDRFFLAVPAGKEGGAGLRVSQELLGRERLLLLEEGHCFRDQALAVCHLQPHHGINMLGASSLSTLVQMVSSGLGVTLLPEISIAQETAHGAVALVRFADPEPERVIGLAWRASSPRTAEFTLLGELIKDVWKLPLRQL